MSKQQNLKDGDIYDEARVISDTLFSLMRGMIGLNEKMSKIEASLDNTEKAFTNLKITCEILDKKIDLLSKKMELRDK